MGSFCYLINLEHRIRVEAYQYSASGSEVFIPTNDVNVIKFLEYCRERLLIIQCVHESFFDNDIQDENTPFWRDFDIEFMNLPLPQK